MHYVVLFALLAASVYAGGSPQGYSLSTQVGPGGGTSFSLTGMGRVTGVRVWERYNSFIYGFQLRYGRIWSRVAGRTYGQPMEIELFDGEAIIQVSGKYATFLQSVVFTTNRGRSLQAGQPVGHSFNMYAEHEFGELRFLSGRYRGAISALGAHWAVLSSPSNITAENIYDILD